MASAGAQGPAKQKSIRWASGPASKKYGFAHRAWKKSSWPICKCRDPEERLEQPRRRPPFHELHPLHPFVLERVSFRSGILDQHGDTHRRVTDSVAVCIVELDRTDEVDVPFWLGFPALFAVGRAGVAFAGEQEEGTFDFLRTAPIRAGQLFASKLAVIGLATLAMYVVLSGSALLVVRGEFPSQGIFLDLIALGSSREWKQSLGEHCFRC